MAEIGTTQLQFLLDVVQSLTMSCFYAGARVGVFVLLGFDLHLSVIAEGSVLQSKLNLVDLSGSERIRKTGAVGHVAREAAYINKSLTSLAMVRV